MKTFNSNLIPTKEFEYQTGKLKEEDIIITINNSNIKEKVKKDKELFNLDKIQTDDLTYLTSARSRAILIKVLAAVDDVKFALNNKTPIDMIEIDLKNIWNLLGDIIGESYDEELLDELFSRFCVGK